MTRINILGKSGSGKHTLGSRLARDLRLAFLPSPTFDIETTDNFRYFSKSVSKRYKKQKSDIDGQQGTIQIGSSALTEFLYRENDNETLYDQPATDILIILLPSEITVQRSIHERGRNVKSYELLFADEGTDALVLRAGQNTLCDTSFIWTEQDYFGATKYPNALRTIKNHLEGLK